MSIDDARQLPQGADLGTTVCIIGAGAAGITIALELAEAGIDTCLIDSGGLSLDEQAQGLCQLESTGYPLRENYLSRARQLGGSCNLWSGRSMLLTDADLRPRDWVPGSGWPIAHEELARHYPQAAQILELPPVDPAALSSYARCLSHDELELFSAAGLEPTISLWARTAQRFGSAWRRRLRAASCLKVLLNATAVHVQLYPGNGSRVKSIRLHTLDGVGFSVRAQCFVLACGGLENARLLLLSRDVQRRGIGNEHDQLGRYFMDHPRAVFGTVQLRPGAGLRALRGCPLANGKLQLGIGLSLETQRGEGLLNHYATFELQTSGYAEARYQALVQTAKVVLRRGHAGSRWDLRSMRLRDMPELMYLLSPKEIMPHWLYRSLYAARQLLPRPRRAQTYIVVYFCEQPPDAASRVTLGEQRDALGLPRLRLHWRIDESVNDTLLRLQQLLAERLRRSGLGELLPGEGDIRYTDASHHMGTTRMSASPRNGVVDSDCRVHGIDNLFIAGSSVFPSAGHANPTITIVALALRLARHLRQGFPAT